MKRSNRTTAKKILRQVKNFFGIILIIVGLYLFYCIFKNGANFYMEKAFIENDIISLIKAYGSIFGLIMIACGVTTNEYLNGILSKIADVILDKMKINDYEEDEEDEEEE